MRQRVFAIVIVVLLLAAGCGAPAAATAPTAAPTAAAERVTFELAQGGGAGSSPAPTMPPTPTPTATPAPTPEPKIKDAWYRQRNDEIAALLVQNGFCETRQEADARVANMSIDPDRPMVALTFDDGPTQGVTNLILDALEQYNGRATFFVVGTRIAGSENLLKRAVSLGCEIGSHTWNHDTLTELSSEGAAKSLQQANDAVKAACGYTVRSLRPPKGLSNAQVKELAGSMGLALVFWNHSTHDYRLDSAQKIAGNVQFDTEDKKALADGDIILLHDLRKPTAEAAPEIIRALTEAGYQLVTVQELLNLSADGFTPGKSYKQK